MTNYDPDRHHRRSLRLRGYDYSQAGAYFITICTRDKECLLGEIVEGEMRLNEGGEVVADEWEKIAAIRDGIELDEWVVMPNHFHGIVLIANPMRAIHESPLQMTIKQRRTMAMSKLIGRFKMVTAKRINELRGTPGAAVCQRDYFEHIIRDESSLRRIREYIVANPARWAEDSENPGNVGATKAGM